MNQSGESYTPGGLLLKGVTVLLAAGVVLNVVAFASNWSQKQLLARYEAAQRKFSNLEFDLSPDNAQDQRIRERDAQLAKLAKEGDANDARQQLIGILEVGLYIVTAIFFLRSLSRANRNARALGAEGMEFTPGWCIGWFFVPFANLVKPFQAVRETWRASTPSNLRWQDNPSSPLLGIWWALWIISNILGQIVFRMSRSAESIPALQSLTSLTLVSDAVGIPLAIVAMVMVRRLYAMQQEKFELAGATTSHASSAWMACRHCGEPVDSLIGTCPMCGESLGSTVADPQKDDNWRW